MLVVVASALFGGSLVVIAVCLVFFPRFFVPSEAMSPTLKSGSSPWAVRADGAAIGRGDIVIYERADNGPPSQVVSRVVAVGGDTVEFANGQALVNGTPSPTDFLAPGTETKGPTYAPGTREPAAKTTTVPADAVYVLGDNRINSRDSRFLGPIPRDAIRYRVVWPSGPSTTTLLLIAGVCGLALVACVSWARGMGPGAGNDEAHDPTPVR